MTEPTRQRVLITGAAGVFGTWISEAFARQGARLLLSDARPEPLQRLADRLAGEGAEVTTHRADLEREEQIAGLADACGSLWGTADVLVNNAGVYPRGRMLRISRAEFERIIAINLFAPFQLSQAIAGQMVEHAVHGSIVNISSGAALSTRPGGGPYSTSKAALAMLTRAFALELAPASIRVNAVAPGFAPGSEVSALDATYVEKMTRTIPLGRTSGPRDAPEAVLFLCSEQASFITGATITVDGGRTAGTFDADRDGALAELA